MIRNIVIKRLLAYIIDIFLFGILGIVIFITLLIVGAYRDFFIEGKINWWLSILNIVPVNILFFLKDITGASPGKKIMKLKIVKNDDNETKPSTIFLIIRNVFLLFGLIELLIMLLRKDKRRLGDLVTKSKVIFLK